MSENEKYPIDIIQDVMTYPELQDMVVENRTGVKDLYDKVDSLIKDEGGNVTANLVVPDIGSVNGTSFTEGTLGQVRIYNRSGGLEIGDLTDNNGNIYGKRLFVSCAKTDEIQYNSGNARNPVSAMLFQYAMKVNSYKDSFMKYTNGVFTTPTLSEENGQIPPSTTNVKTAITAAKADAEKTAIASSKAYTDEKTQSYYMTANNKISSINSRLNVKVKVLPKGDTTGWTIPPSTFAILSTYGATFTGTEKYDDGGSNNQSYNLSDLCIIYSSEKFKVNNNDVYRCFVVYPKNFSLGYDQRQFAAGTCKLKNTYTGNDGSGATHIQYITFSDET